MEIVVKKIKLSKSIIKQMPYLSYDMFDENLDVFGYVRNVFKYTEKSAIIYNINKEDYFVLNMMWKKENDSTLYYTGAFRGSRIKRVENADIYLEKYSKIVSRAENAGHLYI
jgi:hypothetical protein